MDDIALDAVVESLVAVSGKIFAEGLLQAKASPDYADIVYVDWINLVTNEKFEFEVLVTPIA